MLTRIKATPVHPGQLRSPARVLVIVDKPVLLKFIVLTLNHGANVTCSASTAADGATLLENWRPHLVVLDTDATGNEMLQHIRRSPTAANALPIMALIPCGDLKTKLAAFERGADDILTVPFFPEELVARVFALMRRAYRTALPFTPVLKLDKLEIDILNRRVRVGDHELHLTPLEQALLYLLAANAGRVMTRQEILDSLWGLTSRRTATSSTSTLAICARDYRIIHGGRGSSKLSRVRGIASPRRLWILRRRTRRREGRRGRCHVKST